MAKTENEKTVKPAATFSEVISQVKRDVIQVLNRSQLPLEILDLMLENIHLSVHQQILTQEQSGGESKDG